MTTKHLEEAGLLAFEATDGTTRPLAEIERSAIKRALEKHPRPSHACIALGIGRSTLYRKMKELEL